jgi:VanZ family protein
MPVVRRFIILSLAGYWCTIFVLTHMPARRLPAPAVSDKVAHMAAYFGLAALLYAWLWVRYPARRTIGLWVIGICAAYGAADELLQIPVGRSASLGDWLADVAGAMIAVAIWELIRLGATAWRRSVTAQTLAA